MSNVSSLLELKAIAIVLQRFLNSQPPGPFLVGLAGEIAMKFSQQLSLLMLLCFVTSAQAADKLSCADLNMSSSNYNTARETLIDTAGLDGLSQDDDDFIGALCTYPVNEEALDDLVDRGRVGPEEARSISRALDLRYSPPQRSTKGLAYQRANQGLLAKDFCTACASNLADEYAANTDSEFTHLVDRALEGDTAAISQLNTIESTNSNSTSLAATDLKPLPQAVEPVPSNSKKQTKEEDDYDRVYKGMSDLGFYLKPSANFAEEYIDYPKSQVHALVDEALAGDTAAKKKLQALWVKLTNSVDFDDEDYNKAYSSSNGVFAPVLGSGVNVDALTKTDRFVSPKNEVVPAPTSAILFDKLQTIASQAAEWLNTQSLAFFTASALLVIVLLAVVVVSLLERRSEPSNSRELISLENAWFYEISGKRQGPVSLSEMQALMARGSVFGAVKVWRFGMTDWEELSETELASHYTSPPPLTRGSVNNWIAWTLAFLPLISAVIATKNPDLKWIGLVSFPLCWIDLIILRRAGYDTSRFVLWFIIMPLYLYRRASALRQSKGYFWVNVILLAVLLMPTAMQLINQ